MSSVIPDLFFLKEAVLIQDVETTTALIAQPGGLYAMLVFKVNTPLGKTADTALQTIPIQTC